MRNVVKRAVGSDVRRVPRVPEVPSLLDRGKQLIICLHLTPPPVQHPGGLRHLRHFEPWMERWGVGKRVGKGAK